MPKVCRPVSRCLSVIRDQGDLLLISLIHLTSVRENPRRSSENEQIRILLERQKEQILADCQAEILKHLFKADYHRKSIQKLNELIESPRGEVHRVVKETNNFDEINYFFMIFLERNMDLREAHE